MCFRTFTDGALTHLLRAGSLPTAACVAWDTRLSEWLSEALARPLDDSQRKQLFLPLEEGGLGWQSAELRRSPAVLGSWELCFASVTSTLGCVSAEVFCAHCPRLVGQILEAAVALRSFGVDYVFDWPGLFAEAQFKRQKELQSDTYDVVAAHLFATLPDADRIDMADAGGGGGLFLLPPRLPSHRLCDSYFATVLRRRLRCAHPALPTLPNGFSATCNHRGPVAAVCEKPLDARGHHASVCKTGGGVVSGHDAIVSWLAGWVAEMTGHPAPTEQIVQQWTTYQADGQVEELARLDIACSDHDGRSTFVDVCVITASSSNADTVRRRATGAPGLSLQDAVAKKRRRYPAARFPAAALVPFALGSLGRVSPEAREFLRALAPQTAQRSLILSNALQALSCLVQVRLAELLLSASAPPAPGVRRVP